MAWYSAAVFFDIGETLIDETRQWGALHAARPAAARAALRIDSLAQLPAALEGL